MAGARWWSRDGLAARRERRHLDGVVERWDGASSGGTSTELAIERRPGNRQEGVGHLAGSRRLDMGRNREWSQPDQERAGGHADDGERTAVQNRSLDH